MQEADFNWLSEHAVEISKEYAGKWIAVHDGKVVGCGATATEAIEVAAAEVGEAEVVLEAVDKEADVIYGGL